MVVDETRELYAAWGLGTSTAWHVLNPWTQWNQWQVLGKKEGVWSTAKGDGGPNGTRWQEGGAWATDGKGVVRWGGPARTADDVKTLVEGCVALGA